MINCDYYYKAETEEGFKYYGMNIKTKDTKYIDEILDQINDTGGMFVSRKDFLENVTNPMTLNVMDTETEKIVLATLTFESIDLGELKYKDNIIV